MSDSPCRDCEHKDNLPACSSRCLHIKKYQESVMKAGCLSTGIDITDECRYSLGGKRYTGTCTE